MLTQWTRQPPGTANPGVAWDSPLTRGLVGLAVPHLQRELVTGNLGVATTNFAPNTTNPFGLGGRTSEAVSTRLAFAGGWSKVSWPLTLVVVYRLRGTPTASNRIAGNWAANSYGYEITPSTTNFRAFITRAGAGIALTGNAVNTQLQVDVLTIDATNGAYYQKGALVAGPSAHGGMVTPTGSFTFGSSNDGDSSHSAEYYFAALYRRILSDAEIVKISANPWQIFRPIVVPVKTASSGVSIDCTVGNATAAGIQATIQSPISLSCSVGDAVAAGVQATIQSPISVDCSAGDATAAGVSATITVAQSIDCTPGNAVAAGIQASIDEVAGNTTIDCTPGNAVAAGVQASIDFVPLGESSPSYGGGGGTFRAQRSREFNRFIQGLFEEPKKKPLKQKLAQIVEDAKSEEKLQVAISSLQAAFDSKQARENAELALEVETTLRKLQTRLKELEEEEGFVVSNLLL